MTIANPFRWRGGGGGWGVVGELEAGELEAGELEGCLAETGTLACGRTFFLVLTLACLPGANDLHAACDISSGFWFSRTEVINSFVW